MFCSIPASMTFVPTTAAKSIGSGPLGVRDDVNSRSACSSVAPLRIGKNNAWCSSAPVFWKCTSFVPGLSPSTRKPRPRALAGHLELARGAELRVALGVLALALLVVEEHVAPRHQHLGGAR